MYVEYAGRGTGKTLRLSQDILHYLLSDDKNKVCIFAYSRYMLDIILKNIYLSEDLYNKLRYRVTYFINDNFRDSSSYFENEIIIGHAAKDLNVKFYFDDFEEQIYLYNVIQQFIKDDNIYHRIYLASSPHHNPSMMSEYNQGMLKNIRDEFKNDPNVNVLKIKCFKDINPL